MKKQTRLLRAAGLAAAALLALTACTKKAEPDAAAAPGAPAPRTVLIGVVAKSQTNDVFQAAHAGAKAAAAELGAKYGVTGEIEIRTPNDRLPPLEGELQRLGSELPGKASLRDVRACVLRAHYASTGMVPAGTQKRAWGLSSALSAAIASQSALTITSAAPTAACTRDMHAESWSLLTPTVVRGTATA
jgi:hypothetical protein